MIALHLHHLNLHIIDHLDAPVILYEVDKAVIAPTESQ